MENVSDLDIAVSVGHVAENLDQGTGTVLLPVCNGTGSEPNYLRSHSYTDQGSIPHTLRSYSQLELRITRLK